MKRLLLIIFTWWNRQTFGTWLHTRFRGAYVGSDEFGNRYYRHRRNDRRWVIYAGYAEASAVPPGWNAWLHHNSDKAPSEAPYTARRWEKPHQPNLTGTPAAYRPPGSMLAADRRPRVTGDYEPWRP